MKIELIPAVESEKPILENLLELYIYDFSEYLDLDVNNQGLFTYQHLDSYWIEENRTPYLIKVNDHLAGFVLVLHVLEGEGAPYYYIAEFFVMKKYRRHGVGREVAFKVFSSYSGQWLITQVKKNMSAQKFWRRVISDYTKGQFEEGVRPSGQVYQKFNS